MATENKTQKTTASVTDFLSTVKDPERRKDCLTVSKLMKKATGKPGKMWGTSIVGFGDVVIQGKSREVPWFLVGFSPRKSALTLYMGISQDGMQKEHLAKLGPHKRGMGCLYLQSLEDVDMKVLEKMIATTVKQVKAADAKDVVGRSVKR
jgi:hypothetical protein